MGCVYFIQVKGKSLFKIGCTSGNPKERLKSLQIGCPYDLSLYGVIPSESPHALERNIHSSLREFKKRGEWFSVRKSVIDGLLNRGALSGTCKPRGLRYLSKVKTGKVDKENPEFLHLWWCSFCDRHWTSFIHLYSECDNCGLDAVDCREIVLPAVMPRDTWYLLNRHYRPSVLSDDRRGGMRLRLYELSETWIVSEYFDGLGGVSYRSTGHGQSGT